MGKLCDQENDQDRLRLACGFCPGLPGQVPYPPPARRCQGGGACKRSRKRTALTRSEARPPSQRRGGCAPLTPSCRFSSTFRVPRSRSAARGLNLFARSPNRSATRPQGRGGRRAARWQPVTSSTPTSDQRVPAVAPARRETDAGRGRDRPSGQIGSRNCLTEVAGAWRPGGYRPAGRL